jgi:hypothetical protein
MHNRLRFVLLCSNLVDAGVRAMSNPLHASFAMQRLNRQDGFSIGGACTAAPRTLNIDGKRSRRELSSSAAASAT